MTARLSKADQVIPQGIHTVIPFFSLYEKDVYVLIPVRSRLDLEVCGSGCGGFGGEGGEGQGESEKQRGEKASFHKKNSFLRQAISDKPIITDGFIRCQLRVSRGLWHCWCPASEGAPNWTDRWCRYSG